MKKQWRRHLMWIAVLTIFLTGITPWAAGLAARPAGGEIPTRPDRQVYNFQELEKAFAAAPDNRKPYDIEIMADIDIEADLYIDFDQHIRIRSASPKTLRVMEGVWNVSVNGALTLENHVTLRGASAPDLDSAITVWGTFTMNGGQISGWINDWLGGGVRVEGDGVFTMNGGVISGNTVSQGVVNRGHMNMRGGGVFVCGKFTMNGGEITGNIADDGGGVAVAGAGEFIMNGGIISKNAAYEGSGVYVWEEGSFIMHGGEISANMTRWTERGNTVYVSDNGRLLISGGTVKDNIGTGVHMEVHRDNTYTRITFTMDGGQISGNKGIGVNGCGGVYVGANTAFIMNGGQISGNRTCNSGGGVHVEGEFTLNGGQISGNRADGGYHYADFYRETFIGGYGGGVYVFPGGLFTASGGAVSGNAAAMSGSGLFIDAGSTYKETGSAASRSIYQNNRVETAAPQHEEADGSGAPETASAAERIAAFVVIAMIGSFIVGSAAVLFRHHRTQKRTQASCTIENSHKDE